MFSGAIWHGMTVYLYGNLQPFMRFNATIRKLKGNSNVEYFSLIAATIIIKERRQSNN